MNVTAASSREGGPRGRVLMLAFHFPPMKGSSGLQRTLNFARDLPRLGWSSRVMSASRGAYPATSNEQMGDVPPEVVVRRTSSLDTARHLAIRGRYPSFLALPDRWWSWLFSVVPAALRECSRWKPQVIWATYPIPTAILAGRIVAGLSGIPLVLDLRDSITEENYPRDPRLRALLRRIERTAVRKARSVVFTSRGALEMYAARYPDLPAERWVQIANGFDEDSFQAAERQPPANRTPQARRLRLVHSGLLDPVDRDPRGFFNALARIARERLFDLSQVEIVLRATAHDHVYRPLIDALGLGDVVQLAPSVPYVAALREMLDADGLLIFQAANCNHQTPAKLYEYMRAGRPIFCLADSAGDTAAALRAAGSPQSHLAPIDDDAAIAARFSEFLGTLRTPTEWSIDQKHAQQWRRSEQAAVLAGLLDRVSSFT